MAITNYAELQASVIGWANKTNISALVPDFITLAEVRINEQLRAKSLTKALSIPYAAAADSVTFPSDFISALVLRDSSSGRTGEVDVVGNQRYAELLNYPYTADTTRTQLLVTGRQAIFVFPPSQSGTIEGRYYAKEPALSGSNATNDILTHYPDLYLFASLLEVADYLEDNEMAMKYELRFSQAMERANGQIAYVGKQQYVSPGMTVV